MNKTTLAFALTLSAAPLLAAGKAAAVTKAQAEKAVHAAVPGGRIVEAEREKEGGHDIWSFDVKTKEGTREVWVDAHTGLVTSNTLESKAEQAREKAQDAKEKAAKKRKRRDSAKKGKTAKNEGTAKEEGK